MNNPYELTTALNMAYKNHFYAEWETDKVARETYFRTQSIGTVIEVGAGKPVYMSQSKHFGDNGWRRICIEPIPWFVELHKEMGVEIYEFACSDHNEDDVPFQVAAEHDTEWYREHKNESLNVVTHEGFSSLKILEKYKKQFGYGPNDVPYKEIKVKVRKLDDIIEPLNLQSIDYLCVDTEGYELEVLRGFTIEKWYPRVILLEDMAILNGNTYNDYMFEHGYIPSIKLGGLNQFYIKK